MGKEDTQYCEPIQASPQLAVHHVTKTYTGVVALNDVSLTVSPGEIHAVIGENGAGKSTLMHIIAGVQRPDSGSMEICGVPYAPVDERAAQKEGVAIVFQEGSLFAPLSIAENIFAGRQPANRFGIVDFAAMHKATKALLAELEADINPGKLVSQLSPGQCQLVEIAKALSQNVKILILDEPTSSLTINEARHLFKVVKSLASKGVAILYVTHRLGEVFEIADRATVLKDGHFSGTREIVRTTPEEIIHLQVGRELSFVNDPHRVSEDSPVILEVENLCAPSVKNASFKVRAGEIVCLAGLVGAGRTEVCEALFGSRPVFSGSIKLEGKEFRASHPLDAMRAGIGMVPENRHEAGLFLPMTIADNIVAASIKEVSKYGVIQSAAVKRIAEEHCRKLRVASPTIQRKVMHLSGGNQQKVLLAKWLVRKPILFIVDEPTRGVDVGAKSDLYEILRELARGGMALLVVSSDLPEVLSLAHRIVVMSEGRTVGEMDANDATEVSILQLATSADTRINKGA